MLITTCANYIKLCCSTVKIQEYKTVTLQNINFQDCTCMIKCAVVKLS